MKLEGKVALITGGGTGIGAAVAERFVDEGARVCITGRRQEMLDQVARSLPAGTVKTCAGDVSNQTHAERMVSTVIEFGGRLESIDAQRPEEVFASHLIGGGRSRQDPA